MARTAMFCRIPVPRAGTSPLPGPGPEQRPRGPDSRGADRSCCRGGLQPRCAHISPRAPVPQGAAAGVSVGLSRPRRAVLEGEEMARRSGQEGDGHWGVTGPLVTDRVTPWLLGREQRPKLPVAGLPRLPWPATKCCSHQDRNRLNIWASCKVALPALARLCRAFRVTHRRLSHPLSCWVPAISNQLAGHCPETQILVCLECLRRGHRKQSPAQRPRQPEPP